jgi:hypothetical protein
MPSAPASTTWRIRQAVRSALAALVVFLAAATAHASDAIWEALRTPGAFVVMRRTAAGAHEVVGELFVR